MNDTNIDADDSCMVEVAYSCPGRPLDTEMEGDLANVASVAGVMFGGRFSEGRRVAQFSFRRRSDADEICAYVDRQYPQAKTSLVIDWGTADSD